MSYLSDFIDEEDNSIRDLGIQDYDNWEVKGGKTMPLKEMTIPHLNNCLYLLYGDNHRQEFIKPMELELEIKKRKYREMRLNEK